MKTSNYYPSSIYYYQQSPNAPSRMNYIKHDGEEIPELVYSLSRGAEKGQLCIRMGKPKKKKGSKEERTEIVLTNDRMWKIHPELRKFDPDTGEMSKPTSLSNIYEPDINRPGKGHGDIRGTEHAFLSVRDPVKNTIKIMVFPNMKKQQEILFQAWGSEGINEAISNNKVNTLHILEKEKIEK